MPCGRYRFKFFCIALLAGWPVLFFACSTFGQGNKASTGDLLSSVQEHYKAYPAEKLYIKTDRPYYAVSDTIWFKAWLFDAATFTPSKLSGKVYIELINDSSIVIKRF